LPRSQRHGCPGDEPTQRRRAGIFGRFTAIRDPRADLEGLGGESNAEPARGARRAPITSVPVDFAIAAPLDPSSPAVDRRSTAACDGVVEP
jgi:hypothetical protein